MPRPRMGSSEGHKVMLNDGSLVIKRPLINKLNSHNSAIFITRLMRYNQLVGSGNLCLTTTGEKWKLQRIARNVTMRESVLLLIIMIKISIHTILKISQTKYPSKKVSKMFTEFDKGVNILQRTNKQK